MAVRIIPGYQKQLISHVLTELAAKKQRDERGNSYRSDICDWAERHFYIPLTEKPVKLPLHQKAVLRFFFTRGENGHFPFQTIIYSTIKKSGKSTTAGIVAKWFAETQARYGEIYCIGNDLEQAKDRSFKEALHSIELTPGYDFKNERLPGRWIAHKLSLRSFLTGAVIKAIAVDAKGEAGGQPALTVWTELWGAENIEAKRFWDEMTPIPTVPDSIRMVETYAGYDGESELLRGLYDTGQEGHQLTAGELAALVCRPGVEGEEFEDFVNCWHEVHGDPDGLIPVWSNAAASLGMYWDSGMNARRMPWQHMFRPDERDEEYCDMCLRHKDEHDIGITADQYYAAQQSILTPQAYERLHLNYWVGAESQFVPMEAWDACGQVHEVKPPVIGDRSMFVMSADAAVTGDCFGTVLVKRCPIDDNCIDIVGTKKWDPKDSGGQIQLEEPEEFIKLACKANNVVQLAYDPYQLESTAQRLRKEQVTWIEPFNQMGDRLKADSLLYDFVIGRRIHYTGQPELREHIANCNGKMQPDQDSKLRIVKKSAGKKIDLAVALSMATWRCMYLRLGKGEA